MYYIKRLFEKAVSFFVLIISDIIAVGLEVNNKSDSSLIFIEDFFFQLIVYTFA
jgi:hypothetical protein